jgi:branched-chain amino acid transport system ATP-binding protein
VTALLSIEGVTKRFGGLVAVGDLNVTIEPGELVGLIGPNGAGKTTVFNLLTGVYIPTDGRILFDGKLVNGNKPYRVAAMGMARTFQNIRLFRGLTALENVKIASHLQTRAGLAASVLRTPGLLENDGRLSAVAHEMLAKMDLADIADVTAGSLPYGLQRRLEIARALATRPKLLLLDEPAAGMNPQEKFSLMGLIRKIRDDFGLTILLIEHDMKLVMGICERIYVLDYGRIIAEGAPDSICRDPKVIAAYLGEDFSADENAGSSATSHGASAAREQHAP